MSELKRLAIFAGYDKDNIVDDYVVYYIKELKKVADIIYVSDCDMLGTELEKISPYCIHIINGRHGEYDFGSYKRGYLYAYNKNILKDYDYLIFCNDSNFGPLFPISNTFNKIEYKKNTVYGIYKHLRLENLPEYNIHNLSMIEEHLQSHFIIIPKDIFLLEWFLEFIKSINKNDKMQIINMYEIGMGSLFISHNVNMESLYDEDSYNRPYFKPIELIEKGYPFIKKMRINLTLKEIKYISEIIKDSYNIKLIIDYYNRYPEEYAFCDKKEINDYINNYNKLDSRYNQLKIKYDKLKKTSKNIITILQIKNFIVFGITKEINYTKITIFGIKITIKNR